MDYRELQRIIDIMIAMRDGKRIQARAISNSKVIADGEWFDMEGPRLNWQQYDYRIAPEVCEPAPSRKAREWTLAFRPDGSVFETLPVGSVFPTITVREVLPDEASPK
jgi:hypothetical protein